VTKPIVAVETVSQTCLNPNPEAWTS